MPRLIAWSFEWYLSLYRLTQDQLSSFSLSLPSVSVFYLSLLWTVDQINHRAVASMDYKTSLSPNLYWINRLIEMILWRLVTGELLVIRSHCKGLFIYLILGHHPPLKSLGHLLWGRAVLETRYRNCGFGRNPAGPIMSSGLTSQYISLLTACRV